MENLGYKEGSTKPKPAAGKRRMSRGRINLTENEAIPLTKTTRYLIFTQWTLKNYHVRQVQIMAAIYFVIKFISNVAQLGTFLKIAKILKR